MKRLAVFLFCLAAPFLLHSQTVEITTADGIGADAYIAASVPDQNFGLQSSLQVKDNDQGSGAGLSTKIYLRFDLSSLQAKHLASATLRLKVNFKTGTSITTEVYGLRESVDSWSEDQITWNTAPANLSKQAQADTGLNPLLVTSLGSFTAGSEHQAGDTLEFSSLQLRDFLRDDSDGTVTFILIRQGDNPIFNLQFEAKETLLQNSAHFPRLILETASAPPVPPPLPELITHSTITGSSVTIDPTHNFSGPMNGRSFQQDAITSYRGWQYAGYINGDRRIAIARRLIGSIQWASVVIPDYFFASNDAHNIVSIGISPADGRLHLAFDHHVDELHYVVSEKNLVNDPELAFWDASSFSPVRDELNGTRITGITYPRFVTTPEGNLLLTFRIGGSGSGDSHLHFYDAQAETWSHLGILISRSGSYTGLSGSSPNRNAYFDRWQFDADGRLHISWTFRETTSAESNHDIYYAFSDDRGLTWKNNAGTEIARVGQQPITIDSPGIVVVPITQRRWIINTSAMLVDSRRRVHIMARHIPASEPLDSDIRTYHHYWRDIDGIWRGTELSQTGFRPKLAEDANQNLYLVYSNAGKMGLLYASSATQWTDWQELISIAESTVRMGSEPQLDFNRLNKAVLSIFYTETPADGIWGDPQPLRVIEFNLARAQTWANFPILQDGWVNTSSWLGYLFIAQDPWVWAQTLTKWIYLPDDAVQSNGAWLYVPR